MITCVVFITRRGAAGTAAVISELAFGGYIHSLNMNNRVISLHRWNSKRARQHLISKICRYTHYTFSKAKDWTRKKSWKKTSTSSPHQEYSV